MAAPSEKNHLGGSWLPDALASWPAGDRLYSLISFCIILTTLGWFLPAVGCEGLQLCVQMKFQMAGKVP